MAYYDIYDSFLYYSLRPETKAFIDGYGTTIKIKDHAVWINKDVAIKVFDARGIYSYELETQNLLSETGIFPPVLKTFEYEWEEKNNITRDGNITVIGDENRGEYAIVSPYVGKNIRELFYTPTENNLFDGSTITPLADSVPPVIKNRVYDLCRRMKNAGYYMADFRPNNFTLDLKGRVWAIDCGCVYKRS